MGSLKLPLEIIIAILTHADFRTILHCRQLCALLKDVVDGDTSLQYIIELGAAVMEDGPPSDLTAPARLALLRERQSAWRSLTWRSEVTYPMKMLDSWTMYGGVQVQVESGPPGERGGTVIFRQLPSAFRRIETKEWKIQGMKTTIHDICIDPSQDLLVMLVERVSGSVTMYDVHLKSLSTGASHPDASISAVITHQSLCAPAQYTIRIAGDNLGILITVLNLPLVPVLLVWNWRTGEHILHVTGPPPMSFTFLTTRYVMLVAGSGNHGRPKCPRVVVLDLDSMSPQLVSLKDVEYTCELLYPPLGPECLLCVTRIQSDPAPQCRPHPSLRVPFSVADEERLFVVTLGLLVESQRMDILSLVPSSTLLSCLSSIPSGQTRHTVQWADWGPRGSRFYSTCESASANWNCYVYGMSFAYLSSSQQSVVVLDFNQRSIRRSLSNPRSEKTPQHAVLVTELTELRAGIVFESTVQTWLPFWMAESASVPREQGRWIAAMMGEDSLVLVSNRSRSSEFRVLSF